MSKRDGTFCTLTTFSRPPILVIANGYCLRNPAHPMELRHLRYFVAVAEVLSFTKAAQNLRLAQPSLTRQVRNLEEEIGVR
jgi:hypothetical protein